MLCQGGVLAVSLEEATDWLSDMRKATRSGQPASSWFLVANHALYCNCRHFTAKKIAKLLSDPSCSPILVPNDTKRAKPNSFKILVNDPDPLIPGDRRDCELILLFEPRGLPVPLIISAWRSNSPYPPNPRAPECSIDAECPPCQKQRSRRPQGRI